MQEACEMWDSIERCVLLLNEGTAQKEKNESILGQPWAMVSKVNFEAYFSYGLFFVSCFLVDLESIDLELELLSQSTFVNALLSLTKWSGFVDERERRLRWKPLIELI